MVLWHLLKDIPREHVQLKQLLSCFLAALSTSCYAAQWLAPAPEVAIGSGDRLRRLQVLRELLMLSTLPLAQVQFVSQDSVPGYCRVVQHPSRSHWARCG